MRAARITPLGVGIWVSKSPWRLYPLLMLLMVLPIVFFAYSVGEVLKPLAALHEVIWVIQRRVWLLGFAFFAVGLGVSAFMGRLYSQLETGSRFINLSVDMFCVAGFDGFFTSLNPSFEKTLGFTTKELLAKPYLEFIHPDDRQKTVAEATRLEKREVTFAFENRYLCKDGCYKWLLWNAVSVPEQKLIYAVARDITERKRAAAGE